MAVNVSYAIRKVALAACPASLPAQAYFVCDTEAELPVTVRSVGDSAYTIDSGKSWTFSGTIWVELGETVEVAWGEITGTLSSQSDLNTALGGKQPLDADLTTIAGLTATTDNILQSVAGAWASRTPTQVKTALTLNNVDNTSDANKPVSTATQTALDAKQPLDADLTTIAGLTATTDNFLQSASSAWASRTPAQAKTSLALVKGDVGLGNVDNTSDANKPVSTATQTALDNKQPLDADLTTIAGLTATTDNFMVAASSAWASRTPAQAKTSLALVKGDVGLGNVDNTSDANKPVSTATQTALDAKQATLVSGTNIKTINGSTVLGSGDLVVAGAAQDMNPSLLVSTADYDLPTNRGLVLPAIYEIADGFVTDLGVDALLEVA